ncbi:MAG TPA: hypothetical protein VHV09_00680 [Trebonia sp.]|jgi:hypothetical protein|nr:hypothetical protein [Trebonia sp.]
MPETDSDVSASTARFQAFQERGDDLPPSWQMKAPGSKIGILAAVVVVVALLAALFGSLLVG